MVNIPNLAAYSKDVRNRVVFHTPLTDLPWEQRPIILQVDILGLRVNPAAPRLQNKEKFRELAVFAGEPEQGALCIVATPRGAATMKDFYGTPVFRNSAIREPSWVHDTSRARLIVLDRKAIGDLSAGFYGLKVEFYMKGQDDTGVYSGGDLPPTLEEMRRNQELVDFNDLTRELQPTEGTGHVARVDQNRPQSPAGVLIISCFQ